MPAPLNVKWLPIRERMPLMLAVACANVYGGCIAMARRDAVIQPFIPV